MSGLICITKNMSRLLKLKMKTGGKKQDYKHLKYFGYQEDKINKADVTEKEEEDKTDQELPPWIK